MRPSFSSLIHSNSDFNPKGHIAMLSANVMWGLMSPAIKLVVGSGLVAPLVMVDFRIFGAAMLFWTVSIFFKSEHVPASDLLRLAGAAMLGVLFNQGCFVVGVSLTSPGEASLFTTTMPMWVILLAWLILREPVTAKKIGGILLGATGALTLVLTGSQSNNAGGDNPVIGDLIVLMAQLSYALYLTLYRNFIRKYSLITLMKWMFLFASLVSLPITFSSVAAVQWESLTLLHWGGIVYVVAFGTFAAYICIMIGQKNLRPTIVGMYNYFQPIVATGVGVYLGLDTLTPVKCVAIIIIFLGVYLVTISKSRQQMERASGQETVNNEP